MERRKAPYSSSDLNEAKESIRYTEGYGMAEYANELRIPVSAFKDFAGKRVLDLGTSRNLTFARDLEKANIQADVTSFSPAFADESWREGIEGRKDSDKIVAGMGEQLPFKDNSFDRIVCASVVEFLNTTERYVAFLSEIGRVLAPGGVAYVAPIADQFTIAEDVGHVAVVVPEKELESILGNNVAVEWTVQTGSLIPMYTLKLEKKKS